MDTTELFKVTLKGSNLVGGQWKQGQGRQIMVTCPFTNEVMGQVYESSRQDVDEVVEQAEKAAQLWGQTPLKKRCEFLFNFREILLRDQNRIADLVSHECGKTHSEAVAGLLKGIEVLEFSLSQQNFDLGGKMQVSNGIFCEYRREALGVVAGITPFNFPAMVPLWMMPIAIACGNAFILKPSEKTPLTPSLIGEAAKEAGLPMGVFSVVQGGKESVEALLDHPKVKAIAFVGSTAVAKEVYKRGTSNFKRVLALGGAKNHIILLPDADIQMASKAIVDSFTGCAGQRCMAASVLIGVGKIEAFIKAIVDQSRDKKMGKDVGAIISKEDYNRLSQAIDQAKKDGAEVLLDGRKAQKPSAHPDGNWLGPTLLDKVNPKSQAATQELFGPILSIIRVNNISQALQVENSNQFGNAAAVFTASGHLAEKVAQKAKAGMIGINVGVPVPREPFSFGGHYQSKFGHGDITGQSAIEFWSQIKKITTKWQTQSDQTWMG